MRMLTQLLTCNICSSIFAAMSRLKVVSTTWASLPIILLTERTNRENPLLVTVPPGLVLIFCYHLGKIGIIPFFTWVSTSSSLNLTSLIASLWLSHRPVITTSPHVSGIFLLWIIPPFYLMRPFWMRGFPRTQWGEKACLERLMILSRILLWRVTTRPLLLQLGAGRT